jgi:DNA polymerase III epsilon subunit-like protein
MKILVLDTETTAFTPASGQVIELAGVICELDTKNLTISVEKSFEHCVALRGFMDERITRITGITQEELALARPIHKVQDDWFEFVKDLDPTTPIIGHSLQFDLDFLKAEGWSLPENYKKIDSLVLAKILFPDVNAVNLEHLLDIFSLHPNANQLQTLGITDQTQLKSHRALYDSLCTTNLLQTELNRLNVIPYRADFYQTFLHDCLHLPLQFFEKQTTDQHLRNEIQLETQIRFDGTSVPASLYDLLNQPYSSEQYSLLTSHLKNPLSLDLIIIILQLASVITTKQTSPEKTMKFHSRGTKDLLVAELLLTSLHENQKKSESDNLPRIKQFESIVYTIKYLSEATYNITKLVHLVELYVENLYILDPQSPHLSLLQKIVNCYDFFLLALQPFWQRSEYQFNPRNLKPEEQAVKHKYLEFLSLLEELFDIPLTSSHPFLGILAASISKEKTILNLKEFTQKLSPILFRFQGNTLSANVFDSSFSLTDTISNTLLQHPNLIVETYFHQEEFEQLTKLLGLYDVFTEHKPIIEYVTSEEPSVEISDYTGKLSDFIDEKYEVVNVTNKYVLLLCGQNSSLREVEKVLTQNLKPDEYFILGESGSLTKVVSKMMKSKQGIVSVKNGDFYYISRFLEKYEFTEIWIINMPYFQINQYWYNLAKRSSDETSWMNNLKWMHLKGQTRFIKAKTGITVKYLKGYR